MNLSTILRYICLFSSFFLLAQAPTSAFSQASKIPDAQRVNACEYLDEVSIGNAIGKSVKADSKKGDSQKFDGFVMHMCTWRVSGTENGIVSLMLKEEPGRSISIEQSVRAFKSEAPQQGLRTEIIMGLGDVGQYAYWETADRAGITVIKGIRAINITVSNGGHFGAKHKSTFVDLARKVIARY